MPIVLSTIQSTKFFYLWLSCFNTLKNGFPGLLFLNFVYASSLLCFLRVFALIYFCNSLAFGSSVYVFKLLKFQYTCLCVSQQQCQHVTLLHLFPYEFSRTGKSQQTNRRKESFENFQLKVFSFRCSFCHQHTADSRAKHKNIQKVNI